MTHVAAGESTRRGRALIVAIAIASAGLAVLVAATTGDARARPTCFGQPATIVGTNGSDVISTKLTRGKDVVVAKGGNDVIKANHTRNNHGEDVYCGDGGSDKLTGNNEKNKISGGPGNDVIDAGPANDLIVGDNADPAGPESGPTGKDDLGGAAGNDFMVGDNYASGNVSGSSAEKNVHGASGNDKVIGDSASLNGDATGGANDHLAGASGNDLVIGDSYAARGKATGGGNDENNGGPGRDIQVGDGYTITGEAVGGGKDELQAADGGDFDKKCKPHACDDVFYGDGYAAKCGPDATLKAVQCQALKAPGGAPDRLNPDQGDDFMNGGDPDPDSFPGSGLSVDRCDGGTGTNTATRCKAIKRGFQIEIPFP